MGEGCEYIYCSFLLFWHWGGGGVLCSIVPLLPILGGASRRLVVRGWNHELNSDVGVALVISQYLGLGYFGTVGWPRQHCHCPRSLGGPCFCSQSSLWFLLRVLPSHWIGGMWLRIVCASHMTSERILGIYWRWKVGHHLCWVHLGYHIFGTAANRWTSIWMW